jgi:hypothetical protein
MAQADLKGVHYSQQLQSILLRGAWADAVPAKAAKGQPMSWQELMRKFKKHCATRHSEYCSVYESQICYELMIDFAFELLQSYC